MPRYAHLWRHCMINTLNTWLHGRERGFRSRNREIESSGDYKHRPPPEEYRKLREYFDEHAGDEVHIERELRAIVGLAILTYLRSLGFRILAIAVGKVHAHIVVELPKDLAKVRQIIGECKRKSSRAIKDSHPGTVWGGGGEFVVCWEKSHLKNAFEYVIYDQGPGAWTWSYQDSNDDGMFARPEPKERKRRKQNRRRRR
jgi:REP element-mobilizing transposase RayT